MSLMESVARYTADELLRRMRRWSQTSADRTFPTMPTAYQTGVTERSTIRDAYNCDWKWAFQAASSAASLQFPVVELTLSGNIGPDGPWSAAQERVVVIANDDRTQVTHPIRNQSIRPRGRCHPARQDTPRRRNTPTDPPDDTHIHTSLSEPLTTRESIRLNLTCNSLVRLVQTVLDLGANEVGSGRV